MSNGFTKIYKEERTLLRKINTGAAYEVYMHLKDKHNYFKQDVYDYMSYMAEYLEMSESTIKRAIKRLKEVGLIETKREWVYTNGVPKSINIYSFPILNKIENNIEIHQDNTENNMENFVPKYDKPISRQDVTKDVGKTEIQDHTYNYSDKTYEFIDNNEEFLKGRISAIIESKINPQDGDLQHWSNKAYENIKDYLEAYGFRKGTDIYNEVLNYVDVKSNREVRFLEELKEIY